MEIEFELVTVHGEDVLMRTAVNYLDDELGEEVHAGSGACTGEACWDDDGRGHEERYGQEWIIN